MYGDLVLADRGFDIAKALACYSAILTIPPFTKRKPQLSCRKVETARELHRVKIRIARAIGRLKKYMYTKLYFQYLSLRTLEILIDKILFVC